MTDRLEAFVRLMLRHGSRADEMDFDWLHSHNRWTGSAEALEREFRLQEATRDGKLLIAPAPESIDE